MTLLELNNITKLFPVRRGFFGKASEFVRAVDGITLSLNEKEILGLVGESGCGKSTLGRIALGLMKPTSGDVIFDGRDISSLSKNDLIKLRSRMQIIFQDPFSSLNPRMPAGDIVSEPLVIHGRCKNKERLSAAAALLESVGLKAEHVYRYPHEFSGGQRQRICIARAIALNPKFIVADEPVSALDVAVQAEILALLKELQNKFNMAYLFVSHDLRVVSKLCDRVAVMKSGKIVEIMPAAKIKEAGHPYTRNLLASVPIADPFRREKIDCVANAADVC
ncbi:MAG: ABC transporter ATP-binding protein [Deltaproteobacteria bacterium]|nr:ABC transporter ATP-binding protein [Deltaproteobacteria bacterium]MBI2975295.1 ABC transporter ATP-binding protein [Deltaproteobacteria bacterium]